ncbi:hypothetical protein KM043_010068 [Ampulex compressa]|nr:hypothetical protein KM043_010068 [Ampulex compressa]
MLESPGRRTEFDLPEAAQRSVELRNSAVPDSRPGIGWGVVLEWKRGMRCKLSTSSRGGAWKRAYLIEAPGPTGSPTLAALMIGCEAPR